MITKSSKKRNFSVINLFHLHLNIIFHFYVLSIIIAKH